jgi:hypothetical protein
MYDELQCSEEPCGVDVASGQQGSGWRHNFFTGDHIVILHFQVNGEIPDAMVSML